MDIIYTICMAAGVAVPLLELVAVQLAGAPVGALKRLQERMRRAACLIRLGDADSVVSLLPVSVQGICAGLLVFGTAGRLFAAEQPWWIALLAALILGCAGAVGVDTLTYHLKKTERTSHTAEELMAQGARVLNTIKPGNWGTVEITTPDGVTGVYTARAAGDTDRIKSGQKVRLLRFEGDAAVVDREEKENVIKSI